MKTILGLVLTTITMATITSMIGCGTSGPGDGLSSLQIHAHRGGAALRPENTIDAFGVAIRNVGVDSVELDIRQTSDHQLVVTHNERINPALCLEPSGHTVKRSPPISKMTFAQVRAYDCGSPVGLRKGTPIATLDEVFAATSAMTGPSGTQTEYDLHIKWDSATIDADTYASLLLAVVQSHGLLARAHFMAEAPAMLAAVRTQSPNARLYYLMDAVGSSALATALQYSVEAVAPGAQTLRASDVQAFHAQHIKVIPWTVNEPFAWVSLSKMGVDGIITDNPLGLRELLDGNESPLDLAGNMPLGD